VTKIPTTAAGLAATNKLLEQVIFLVDTLAKTKSRGEVVKKLNVSRVEPTARFTKSLAALEDTLTQQELAQKKEAKRERAEREKVAKLSAKEQRKYIEKEKARTTKSTTTYPPSTSFVL
jgi:Protein of unknown function (DUF1682)